MMVFNVIDMFIIEFELIDLIVSSVKNFHSQSSSSYKGTIVAYFYSCVSLETPLFSKNI